MSKISVAFSQINNRFIGQISSTFVSTLLIQATGMATGILLARLLGPEKRGELAAVQLWGAFFATLALIGLPESVVYFGAKDEERIGTQWSSGVLFTLILGLPIVLIGYFILPILLREQSAGVVGIAQRYTLMLFLAFIIGWLSMGVARGSKRFTLWNMFRILPTLGWLIVICLAWFLNQLNVNWLSFGFVWSYAIVIFVLMIVLATKVDIFVKPDLSLFWPMVSYGFPLMISLIPTSLVQAGRLSQLFIASLLDSTSLGYFTVAVSWSNLIVILPTVVGQVIFPRIAALQNSKEQNREILRGFHLSLIVTVTLVIGVALLTSWVIPLLFGTEYNPSVSPAIILIIATGFRGLRNVLNEALRGLGRPRLVLYGEIIGLIIISALLPIFLLSFNVLGAAICVLIGDAIALVIVLLFTLRNTSLSFRQVIVPNWSEISEAIENFAPAKFLK